MSETSSKTPHIDKATPELLKITRDKIGKYSSAQLFPKLEAGTLIGLSKEVAIEILIKRGELEAESFAGEPLVRIKGNKDFEQRLAVQGTKETAPKKAVVKKAAALKKELVKKDKVAKEAPKKRAEVLPIDETLPKIKAILEKKETSKTEKIQALFKLNYTANQISKCSLKAHYSFCHTIKSRMDAEK